MELVAEPLVGFRAWKLSSDGDLLRPCWQSQALNTWLPDGPAVAECLTQYHMGMMYANVPRTVAKPKHPDEEPPSSNCCCGIYAYYQADPIVDNAVREHRSVTLGVWGAMVAWGKIIECERGFKAQFAKPIAFLEQKVPDITSVADRYQVPILPLDELGQYALMWGEVR